MNCLYVISRGLGAPSREGRCMLLRSTHPAPAREPRGPASPATSSSWIPMCRSRRGRPNPRSKPMLRWSWEEVPRRRTRPRGTSALEHLLGRSRSLPRARGSCCAWCRRVNDLGPGRSPWRPQTVGGGFCAQRFARAARSKGRPLRGRGAPGDTRFSGIGTRRGASPWPDGGCGEGGQGWEAGESQAQAGPERADQPTGP